MGKSDKTHTMQINIEIEIVTWFRLGEEGFGEICENQILEQE